MTTDAVTEADIKDHLEYMAERNRRRSDLHDGMIQEAASLLIAVADDSGTSLVDVIAEAERYAAHVAIAERHRRMVHEAAILMLLVSDSDRDTSLVDVIARTERYIIEETKVGDAAKIGPPPPGYLGYTLVEGRLVEIHPTAV